MRHAHYLRICAAAPATKAPSPSHQTKSWRMRSARDSLTQKQTAWRINNRKTCLWRNSWPMTNLKRIMGKITQSDWTKRQENRIRATSRCSTLVLRLQAQWKCTVSITKKFSLPAKCIEPNCQQFACTTSYNLQIFGFRHHDAAVLELGPWWSMERWKAAKHMKGGVTRSMVRHTTRAREHVKTNK